MTAILGVDCGLSARGAAMTRLSDVEVDAWTRADQGPGTNARVASILAAEVQAWRHLVNGGLCQTCRGRGYVDARRMVAPACPDCDGTGRRPGLIERLEYGCVAHTDDGCYILRKDTTNAVIEDLRRMEQ